MVETQVISLGWSVAACAGVWLMGLLFGVASANLANRKVKMDLIEALRAAKAAPPDAGPGPVSTRTQPVPSNEDLHAALVRAGGIMSSIASQVDRHSETLRSESEAINTVWKRVQAVEQAHQQLAQWVHAVPQKVAPPTPPLSQFMQNHTPSAADIATHAAQLAEMQNRIAAEHEKAQKSAPAT
jgi:hypothetical protein